MRLKITFHFVQIEERFSSSLNSALECVCFVCFVCTVLFKLTSKRAVQIQVWYTSAAIH